MPAITVIGAGLAGCEAALQCARYRQQVRLIEMRPEKMTPAHQTGDPAELVCSNSLKSESLDNAHGLLKAELRAYGSVMLQCAERARIPGGKALVVDRQRFSAETAAALTAAGIRIVREETVELPAGITIVATGPLTSQALARELIRLLGHEQLFFYDAIAPIVAADSIDMSRVFAGSRYNVGNDYLNCPMDETEYDRFVAALNQAELYPVHEFDRIPFFAGCLPIEEMAGRGRMALAFGPLKPVGLSTPDGHRPFAVVQLRRENLAGTMYNLVGFQTRLRRHEQERVFRLIPGLERAHFLRYGSVHRNTFLNSPRTLLPTLQTRAKDDLFIAGQLTGVEGYVESLAAGLVAGINACRLATGQKPLIWPLGTILGALLNYIATPVPDMPESTSPRPPIFQPMNANFGLLPPLPTRAKGRTRRQLLAEAALAAAMEFAACLAVPESE